MFNENKPVPKYTDIVSAKFTEPPLKLDDGGGAVLVVESLAFTAERGKFNIVTQKGNKFSVTTTENLLDEHQFDFLSAITGKKLTFKNGNLISFESVGKPGVKSELIKSITKTRTPDVRVPLNDQVDFN